MTKKFFIRFIVCLLLPAVVLAAAGCSSEISHKDSGTQDETEYVTKGDGTVKRLEMNQVSYTDGLLAERFGWNDKYLLSLDMDRLLYWYRDQAGITQPEGCKPYPDWENSNIFNGITIGHYLAGCSMMYKYNGSQEYLDRVNYICEQLVPCQKDNGLIFAYDESRFDKLEKGGDVQQFGPDYYYVAKTLYGLTYSYSYCGNETALELAKKLGDWICMRTAKSVSDGTRNTMLNVEYGDIVYALFELYDITKNEELKKPIEYFTQEVFLEGWSRNDVNIWGMHANTLIPKAIGMILCYNHGMDEKYLKAAENFWNITTGKFMYANGGFSTGEGFGPLYEGANAHEKNPCETCTIYNTIRLSQYLYETTQDLKYLDYMERAALNGIMASINDNGCKTYYQHMEADAYRVYHAPEAGFWCCTGTGLENFQRLLALVGYERSNGIDINMFVSSRINSASGISVEIKNDDAVNNITVLNDCKGVIRLRIPLWAGECTLKDAGGADVGTAEDGYFVLKGEFKAGDTFVYTTPFTTQIEWSDVENVFTLRYGPYQMVSTNKKCSEVSGKKGEGWLANPGIYKGDDAYYINMDGNILTLQKYGAIYKGRFTTFFILK